MTGKEAAKRGWEGLSARSAIIFIFGGLAAVIVGKYVEGADAATFYGWIAGGWGLAQSLIERTAKRTGDEFEVRVWRNFGEHKALIDKGDREHAACEEQHAEAKTELRRLRTDVNEIASAVESVKPGWKFGIGS